MIYLDRDFTVSEVAENLGITVQAVSQYLRLGKMVGFKVGNRWRISVDSVEKFLQNSNKNNFKGEWI